MKRIGVLTSGGDAQAVRHGTPAAATELMVAYAYDTIARGNPVGFLGMVHVLEGTSVALALMAAGVCDRRTPSGVALRGYVRNPAMVGRITNLEVVWHRKLKPGYGWIFPCRDGVFNIGVGLAHSHASDDEGHGGERGRHERVASEPGADGLVAGERLLDDVPARRGALLGLDDRRPEAGELEREEQAAEHGEEPGEQRSRCSGSGAHRMSSSAGTCQAERHTTR